MSQTALVFFQGPLPKFLKHIRALESQCDRLSFIRSYTDKQIRKLEKTGALKKGGELLKSCNTSITESNDTMETNARHPRNPSNNNTSAIVERYAPIMAIFVKFGKKFARFLSIDKDQLLLIGHSGFPTMNASDYYLKMTPNFTKKRAQTIMIYSDIVQPSIRVAGFQTNLLDIVSVKDSSIIQRPLSAGLYRPLKDHKIHSISIAKNIAINVLLAKCTLYSE